MKFHLPVVALALCISLAACSDQNPVEALDNGPIDIEQSIALKGGSDKAAICHFPPGNPDNPQNITVGSKAAANHIDRHDGDGYVGDTYDENAGIVYDQDCVALPIPNPNSDPIFVQDNSGTAGNLASCVVFSDPDYDQLTITLRWGFSPGVYDQGDSVHTNHFGFGFACGSLLVSPGVIYFHATATDGNGGEATHEWEDQYVGS